ncbi:hypothetical protein CHS0354_010198 [Potamilus streckersoni]|uniref:SH3 domain-containing protein n=1 Tax=Potamilus streckersoni TaxID=2493646 RepID=A0AAE0RT13_9BIVA|nr:hypothetical protein CHS0354_010198 [Potamilus streckersoni]
MNYYGSTECLIGVVRVGDEVRGWNLKLLGAIDVWLKITDKPLPDYLKRQLTISESAEIIRPIKESKQSKNLGQTDTNTEKRMAWDMSHEKVIVKSSDSDTDSEVPDAADVTTLANVKVIAIEGYIGQNRDELTFKIGQKIKQKIPANSDGMAYGWIRKGKLKKKTYGYYPANLVEFKPKKERTGIRGRLFKKGGILKIAS